MREIAHDDWWSEGVTRFGKDWLNWEFVCPVCGHVAKIKDWEDAGAPREAAAFSCVGRWLEKPRRAFEESGEGPCNYAGRGLFPLNPVIVVFPDGEKRRAFEFAD